MKIEDINEDIISYLSKKTSKEIKSIEDFSAAMDDLYIKQVGLNKFV